MTNSNLKKEVEIFNNSSAGKNFFKHLQEIAKNGNFSVSVVMFNSPSTEGWKNKKQLKTFKEERKKLSKFFKEDGKKLILQGNTVMAGIPQQLEKVILESCAGQGFNYKPAVGGELFSLINVDKENRKSFSPEMHDALRLSATIKEPLNAFKQGAYIAFSEYKIRQIIPLSLPEVPGQMESKEAAGSLVSLESLKEYAVTCKNYDSIDNKSKILPATGLNYLVRIRNETDPLIKLFLLFAAFEFFFKPPVQDVQQYLVEMCSELTNKIGFSLGGAKLFNAFYNTRVKLLKDTVNASSSEAFLSSPEGLPQVERFFRELLKKMINDTYFLKQTLPKLKTSQKKELKKQKLKKKWRKFPGRYLARFFEEP